MTKQNLNGQTGTPASSSAKPATLHHVGFVVASISQVGSKFADSLGAQWNGEIIHDPLQEARVTFLRCAGPETPAVELVEPDGEKSQLHNFLRRGGGLHHVCYEVDSLNAQLEQSRSAGCVVLRKPLPAAAFGGRLIAWVYTRERLLLEYLERSSALVQTALSESRAQEPTCAL
jgi:catechol 2,3-dioxygenase-like lactoylglutathione lyase family enzyme